MKKKILFLLIFGMVLFSIASVNAFNWTDGIISYYKLDNTTGDVYDMLGDYHGTNVGATRGATGKIRTAFDFEKDDPDYVTMGDNFDFLHTEAFSVSMWIYREDVSYQYPNLFSKADGQSPYKGYNLEILSTNKLRFNYVGDSGYLEVSTDNAVIPTTATWYHVVLTYNNKTVKFYVDGDLKASTVTQDDLTASSGTAIEFNIGNRDLSSRTDNDYDGIIDEVPVFGKELNSTDVLELWNDGYCLGYGAGYLKTILISPENAIVISTIGENFTANYTATSTLTNATYYVWDNEGAIFNQTTIIVTGESNTTTLYIDEFTLGTYEWNVEVCEDTGNCVFAIDNFTLVAGATRDYEQYNNYTYETSSETFKINITLVPSSTLYNAQLFYNGIPYEGEITLISVEKYSITTTIDIPTINSSSELKDFFWQLIYPVGEGIFTYQNLTGHDQNVSQIQLGNCSGGLTVKTLNFTNWDEENRTMITPFDFHGTFLYWLGSGSTYENFSISSTNITSQTICILPSNLTYYSDAQIQYEKSAYVKRSYYLINATLTNTTQYLKLFSLLTPSATTFILEVIDEAQIPVVDAYLYIQRYYAGVGIFETIAMAKTDITGSTIGHFEKETEDYKIIVFKEGEVLFESGVQKIFCRETPCTITFQIKAAAGTMWNDFGDIVSLIWSLEFNEDTNIWTYTYVDTSGTTQFGRLHVYYIKGNKGKITICDTNSSSASATLTCNITGYEGTIYAAGYISRSPEILVYLKTAVIKTIKAILGLEGLFLSMFILLFLGLIGLWNPVVGIISVVGGMIILNFMGLASFGAVTIWGVIFIALILLWELKS